MFYCGHPSSCRIFFFYISTVLVYHLGYSIRYHLGLVRPAPTLHMTFLRTVARPSHFLERIYSLVRGSSLLLRQFIGYCVMCYQVLNRTSVEYNVHEDCAMTSVECNVHDEYCAIKGSLSLSLSLYARGGGKR